MNIQKRKIEKNRSQKNLAPVNEDAKLERLKTKATIFSAVAIPIVLTISGYFIQKQLGNEGIKKDYVGFAANILRDNPASQEPELRAWAVNVLDEYSPIAFSKKAKDGLYTGMPVVTAGPAWLGPYEKCRKPPKKRTISTEFLKLSKTIQNDTSDIKAVNELLLGFIDKVVDQEGNALETIAHLECMQ